MEQKSDPLATPVGDSYVHRKWSSIGLMERMKQHGEVFHVPNKQEVMF